MSERGAKAWENFDRWADCLVKKEASFDAFARAVKADVSRMAWAASRRRRPPFWMGQEDIEVLILNYLWHYAFEHRSREGIVGFDVTKGTSAGAYLRWNAAQHVQKDIGKARGENMHSHRLIGPAPEAVTKTGEIELSSRSGGYGSEEEQRFDDGRQEVAMDIVMSALKEFATQPGVAGRIRAVSLRAPDGKWQTDIASLAAEAAEKLLEQPAEILAALGIRTVQDAKRVWRLFFVHGNAPIERRRRGNPLPVCDFQGFDLDSFPSPPSGVYEVAPAHAALAPKEEERHPNEDADGHEESILVEEGIKTARATQRFPTRTRMVIEHGKLRSFQLGCRCPACRQSKVDEWRAWAAKKKAREQAREKEAA